ncbi:MAG: hypothetical protein II871_03270 [Clostridia bacterium]|nr:hypothetical protein [Clostridia bacterium]
MPAAVVSKRTSVYARGNPAVSGAMHTHSSTSYYVTFEVESCK